MMMMMMTFITRSCRQEESTHCATLHSAVLVLQTSIKDAPAKYVEKYSVPEGDDRMRNPGPPYACPVVPMMMMMTFITRRGEGRANGE